MSKLQRYDFSQDGSIDPWPTGEYVLYTDAKARHEQLLAALNGLIKDVEFWRNRADSLRIAKEQAEKLKEI